MSDREDGFYWVRWANNGNGASWAPTWWDGEVGEWWIDGDYDDGLDIVEIGSRIPEPNAAPAIGTRYRNEAGEVVSMIVPAHPTEAMRREATKAVGPFIAITCWDAMLAALPEPK